MKSNDLLTVLIDTYYEAIFQYCYVTLRYDEQAAKDCTQETFFILVKKKSRLNLQDNMRIWLYKTADRVMRNYIRKEKRYRDAVPIDEIELPAPVAPAESELESLCACLSSEEYAMLTAYYDASHGERSLIAAQFGISVQALYKRIDKIKQKLRKQFQQFDRK